MIGRTVSIHASSNIPWQKRYAVAVKEGLSKHGIDANITSSRKRESDVSVIHGPNLYQAMEKDGGNFIMLNRKFLGFEERDVHDNCAISWNGFNGMGIFCVDRNRMDGDRLEKYIDPREIEHWSLDSDNYLLCHQHDTGRSTRFDDINKWYRNVQRRVHPNNLKIRRKITLENVGRLEFMRSLREDLSDVKAIFSLNSIVSVEALILGKGLVTDDKTNPCYGVASSEMGSTIKPFDRTEFLTYLANCQWHIDEIRNGSFFHNMEYGPQGKRLHEFSINKYLI
jgi:hypothetical protein|tara:strand:+ start:2252 stop:3097 length:846 start_codon:yes stop_codon:yes gene_type:complete